mmetsp:Transcript_74725/g.120651  ORF Transcript_74725/g.120651 Transcript_74725/m.120651 type:complete len:101 (+) Transcript_74725:470-772(+)
MIPAADATCPTLAWCIDPKGRINLVLSLDGSERARSSRSHPRKRGGGEREDEALRCPEPALFTLLGTGQNQKGEIKREKERKKERKRGREPTAGARTILA